MTDCSVTKKTKFTQVCRCAFCFSYNLPFPGITRSVFIFINMKTFQPKAELHFTGCSRRAYSPVPGAVHLKGKEKKRFAHLQCRKRGTDSWEPGMKMDAHLWEGKPDPLPTLLWYFQANCNPKCSHFGIQQPKPALQKDLGRRHFTILL